MESNDLSSDVGAFALARSLYPHIETIDDMDEFLLFPPDLFAYTSLILTTTGAYRLIVSPPKAISDASREVWMPTEDENMRDFSEFNEDSSYDFKDTKRLYNELFIREDYDVSKFLRTKMEPTDIKEVSDLYEPLKDKTYDEKNSAAFAPLERKISHILNKMVKGKSLYHEVDKVYKEAKLQNPKTKHLFQDTNFSEEFWELLNCWDDHIKTSKERTTRRINRLLLEGAYPNEIRTSLTWDGRVREAGLDWRKNLAGKFDEEEQRKFIKLKQRDKLKFYSSLIDGLVNYEPLTKKRNEILPQSGEIYKKRLEKIKDTIQKTEDKIKSFLSDEATTEYFLSDGAATAAAAPTEFQRFLSDIEKVDLNDEATRDGLKKMVEQIKRENSNKRREEIRKRVEDKDYVPKVLKQYWDNFKEEISPLREGNIKDLLCEGAKSDEEKRDLWQRFVSLVSMHAIADEACAGWGIRGPLKFIKEGLRGENKSNIQSYAEELLSKFGSLATINSTRCRVLPKRHTAEVGITLRSISCNLGFHRSSVEVKWKLGHTLERLAAESSGSKSLTSLNVLLLPIPLEIHTTDFKKKEVPVKSHQRSQDFFEYNPKVFDTKIEDGKNPGFVGSNKLIIDFERRIEDILERAREEVGQVDMVILPEIAIHEYAVEFLEKALLADKEKPVTAYIAGVRESREKFRFNRNAVYFKIASNKTGSWKFSNNPEEYAQYKHHRWKLERQQIIQYQLGGALSPTKSWWEAIKIGDRQVNFVNIGEQLTVCPLICEDLARQDPISDLIRTVGPTLVVAILMDGPQILQRWAGKYASVLGDDPGSSVITLTSYGMVNRSLAPGTKPSRVVALWSSPESKREIELEENAEAILLSLSIDERKEKSSDGREEMGGTPSLSLAGIRQIKLKDFEEAKRVLRC